jgi:hypothetical protein
MYLHRLPYRSNSRFTYAIDSSSPEFWRYIRFRNVPRYRAVTLVGSSLSLTQGRPPTELSLITTTSVLLFSVNPLDGIRKSLVRNVPIPNDTEAQEYQRHVRVRNEGKYTVLKTKAIALLPNIHGLLEVQTIRIQHHLVAILDS